MLSTVKFLLSLLLLKSTWAAVPSRSENAHFLQIILAWIVNEKDLRLVSRTFKEGYDASRYWLLPPHFRSLLLRPFQSNNNCPFSLLKPEIGLDIVIRQVSSATPSDFESFKQLVNAFLLSLPVDTDESDRQYWKTFKLLKFSLQSLKRIGPVFDFDLTRLVRIIASRQFNEAECFQLFVSENAPVSKTICPASGRNAF